VKKDIHPNYKTCNVTCACGSTFETKASQPEINVEICSQCHPFFTGKQKFVDSEGRVQRFQKKFGAMASTTKS
jgi:large subunit ribosomal protein L31